MMLGLRRWVLWFLAITIAGCGGTTTTAQTSGGSPGAAGDGMAGAGAAGNSATGGSAGSVGGSASGSAGSGGGAVTDASAGTGGAPMGSLDGGVTPECTSDKDCKIFTDCCACEAVPSGEMPPSCDLACKQNRCASLGLAAPQAACVAGRWGVGFECDSPKVLCKSLPPECPPGQVALVRGACWQGGCVAANECASVKDCAACTGALVCAEFVQRGGPTVHCYDVPTECKGNYGCSCAGAAICSAPGLSCVDLSGLKGIACSCPAC